ncbi:MAG: arginase [Elusimicrobiota bacterium]
MSGKKRHATVIGVPLDYGASKKGASGGPAAVRRANLIEGLEALDMEVVDVGDLVVPKVTPSVKGKLKNGSAILKICQSLEKQTYEAVANGSTPITLGGDHSLSVGSVSGVARAFRDKGRKVGLIWVDAHADMNTPDSSPTGNVHGMPLAHLLGLGHRDFARLGGFVPKIDPRNVVLLGVRDVDKAEAVNIRSSGIRVFSMQEIDRFGMGVVTEQAIDIANDGTAGFHVSFDIDCVDPGNAPGTGTTKRGGLTYRESHLFMELVADSERMVGLDLVEVNPLEDTQNATAVLASELIASAMGKNIY